MSQQPTNGPYHWGNGPKPKKTSVIKAIIKAITKGGKKK